MRTIVNEGVIVRHGTARNNQEYLVLWSLASNHSFIFKNDIATDEWFEVDVPMFEVLWNNYRQADVNGENTTLTSILLVDQKELSINFEFFCYIF